MVAAKNNSAAFLQLILLILLVEGCTKNDVSPSTCQLASYQIGSSGTNYYYTNNQLTGGQDANGIYSFSYDKQDRISQIAYNSGTMVAIRYDGNNRIIKVTWTFKPLVADNIIWDAPLPAPTIYHYTYNQSGQMILQQYFLLNTSGDSTLTDVKTFQYPGTSTHNYSTSSWITYGNDTLTTNYVYQYDNRINPFRQSIYTLTSSFSSTDNNVAQVAITQSSKLGTFTGTSDYVYTYTNNGYPLKQTLTSNGSLTSYSTTFTYTNCH